MSHRQIGQIAIANSPLTKKVIDCIDNLRLPYDTKKRIDDEQSGKNVRDMLKLETIIKEGNMNDLESKTVNLYLEIDSIVGAKSVLEQSKFLHNKKILAELEIAGRNYTRARVLVDSIGELGGVENANYADLLNVLIDMGQDSVPLFKMDSVQEAIVRQVAASSTMIAIRAEVVLTIAYGEKFKHPIMKIQPQALVKWASEQDENNRRLNKSQEQHSVETENNYFNLYPNPNDGNIVLDYSIAGEQDGIFVMTNVMGEVVVTYPLYPEQSKLTISEAALKNGVYFYQVLVNEAVVKSAKIIVVK